MEPVDQSQLFIALDEYGRTYIDDRALLELVAGSGDLWKSSNKDRCNAGCHSNVACTNLIC